MKNKHNYTEIIQHCLEGSITQNELEKLVDWLEENPNNLILFNRQKEVFESQQLIILRDTNETKEAYKRLLERTKPKSKRIRFLNASFYKIAVSALVVLGISVLAFNLIPGLKKDDSNIHPVIDQPYIISASGEKFTIQPEKEKIRFDELLSLTTARKKIDEKEGCADQINELVVPKGRRISIELADGSIVWLNSDSRLFYPQVFKAAARRVKLEGEGFFKVAKDADHPFIVETNDLKIEVLGTSFNVSAFPGDNHITTTLVEGLVRIHQPAGDEVLLHPNQSGVYLKENKTMIVEDSQTELYTSWINGYYTFHSESLEIVIQKLTRSYGIPIILESRELKDLKFSGKLDLKETLADVLDVIKLVAPIEYLNSDTEIIIQKTKE